MLKNSFIPRYTHHFCQSMFPLLQNKDILEIESKRYIRKRDIVLYRSDEKRKWIAHRVIDIQAEKFITKGDNNLAIDDRKLDDKEIAGIVVARWRNGKCLKIYRGYLGFGQYRLYSTYFFFRRLLARRIKNYTLPECIHNKLSAILPQPREVVFLKNEQQQKTLYLGSIHIGTYSHPNECWQIRFPWRLLYSR